MVAQIEPMVGSVVTMARQLVSAMTGPFEPENYKAHANLASTFRHRSTATSAILAAAVVNP